MNEKNTESEYHIFVDTSVNHQHKILVGSYLFLQGCLDSNYVINDSKLKNSVEKYVMEEFSTSTAAEELNIMNVINIFVKKYKIRFDHNHDITLYTDCKGFYDVVQTRQYQENFQKHEKYEFYTEFLDLIESYQIKVEWVQGHKRPSNHYETYLVIQQQIFWIVDKVARDFLRKTLKNIQNVNSTSSDSTGDDNNQNISDQNTNNTNKIVIAKKKFGSTALMLCDTIKLLQELNDNERRLFVSDEQNALFLEFIASFSKSLENK